MIHLNVILPTGATTEHRIPGSVVTVGRSSSCEVPLRDCTSLSRRHCELRVDGELCVVKDLSSKNGVQINGRLVTEGSVEVGDELTIGDIVLEIVEFGPEGVEPGQVKACLECGHIMPFEVPACSECGTVAMNPSRRLRTRITRDHIPGYRLRRKIGSGGMGIVFEAERRSDGQVTAIKILRPHLARDPAYLVRFVEETRVLTLLEHPNIVKIHGRGSDNGLVYIDMELVDGESVRALVRRARRMGERQALRVIWDVALALDYAATQRRVVHGDVKPGNFMIDRSGVVKLCDFGLARLFDFSRMKSNSPHAPGSSGRRGTAAYAAPERFEKGARPTIAADIYSLGVSLFQMLTGALPFGSNQTARLHRRPEDRAIPDPRTHVTDVRESTHMLLESMMAPLPATRYSDYKALQVDLGLLLD